jgi:hypothetical protein
VLEQSAEPWLVTDRTVERHALIGLDQNQRTIAQILMWPFTGLGPIARDN